MFGPFVAVWCSTSCKTWKTELVVYEDISFPIIIDEGAYASSRELPGRGHHQLLVLYPLRMIVHDVCTVPIDMQNRLAATRPGLHLRHMGPNEHHRQLLGSSLVALFVQLKQLTRTTFAAG